MNIDSTFLLTAYGIFICRWDRLNLADTEQHIDPQHSTYPAPQFPHLLLALCLSPPALLRIEQRHAFVACPIGLAEESEETHARSAEQIVLLFALQCEKQERTG